MTFSTLTISCELCITRVCHTFYDTVDTAALSFISAGFEGQIVSGFDCP